MKKIITNSGRRRKTGTVLKSKLALKKGGISTNCQEHMFAESFSYETNEDNPAEPDWYRRCYNAAIRCLSYRPRSEHEVTQRLMRHGYSKDTINKVISKLKEQKLIDDTAFALFWKDNRDTFQPRSQSLIKMELKKMGVANDIIEKIGQTDDAESAYRAAIKKARSLSGCDYQEFSHRLSAYLNRRGYSYNVINHTVEQLWQAHNNTT